MTILALHIVAIGSVVGVTAYIAYYFGKKNGLNSSENEQGSNENIKLFVGFGNITNNPDVPGLQLHGKTVLLLPQSELFALPGF